MCALPHDRADLGEPRVTATWQRHAAWMVVALVVGCSSNARLYVEDGAERSEEFRADAATRADSRPDDDDADGPDRPSRDAAGGADPGDGDAGGGEDDAPPSNLEPACIVAPESVDFGSGAVGDTGEVVFRIENCGGLENDNLVITNVYFVDDAEVQSSPALSLANNPTFPLSIGPFDGWPFQVRFRPTAAGRATGVIRVESNAAGSPSVDIPVEAIAE